MNIYFVDSIPRKNHPEILTAMKKAVRNFYRGFDVYPTLSSLPDSDHQFFLEGPDGLLWGRVYYEPLTRKDLDDLRSEGESLFRTMQERVTLYIFFPSMTDDAIDYFQTWKRHARELVLKDCARFFEYYFLHAQTEIGIAFREWIAPLEKDRAVISDAGHSDRPANLSSEYHFFEQSRLSRDELQELIEIGIELKKNSAFPFR